MTYYTLLERDLREGTWHIQFGDQEKAVVAEELECFWRSMKDLTPKKDVPKKAMAFKIIKTKTARQSEINAAVAKLNETAQDEWLNSFAP